MGQGLQRARAILRTFATARADREVSPTLAEQVEATLSVNGFIRYSVTGDTRVTVTLHEGHYRTDGHRSLTLAKMSNRCMDYGLLTETRDCCLYVIRRGVDR